MKKRGIIGIIILIVIVVVVIIGAIFASLVYFKGKAKQPEISSTSSQDTVKQPETLAVKPATQFLTYNNSFYGIIIKYPSDWIKNDQITGSVVAFSSPKESSLDSFQENLNIIVQNQDSSMTLEKYTNWSIFGLNLLIKDVNISESSSTVLDGNPAYKIVYTGKEGQYTLKWMQVWTLKDHRAYLITYTAEEDKYSYFLETIQEMLNSFQITDRIIPVINVSNELTNSSEYCGQTSVFTESFSTGISSSWEEDNTLVCIGKAIQDGCKNKQAAVQGNSNVNSILEGVEYITYQVIGTNQEDCKLRIQYPSADKILYSDKTLENNKKFADKYIECPVSSLDDTIEHSNLPLFIYWKSDIPENLGAYAAHHFVVLVLYASYGKINNIVPYSFREDIIKEMNCTGDLLE